MGSPPGAEDSGTPSLVDLLNLCDQVPDESRTALWLNRLTYEYQRWALDYPPP